MGKAFTASFGLVGASGNRIKSMSLHTLLIFNKTKKTQVRKASPIPVLFNPGKQKKGQSPDHPFPVNMFSSALRALEALAYYQFFTARSVFVESFSAFHAEVACLNHVL